MSIGVGGWVGLSSVFVSSPIGLKNMVRGYIIRA